MVFTPPSFNDIGKAAKDLFSKGFYLGEVKVEHKSKTRSGLELTASGSLPRDNDHMTGSLETKYNLKQYGCTLTTKFASEAVVTFTAEQEDKLLKGLKLTTEASVDAVNQRTTLKKKAAYKRNGLNFNFDIDLWPLSGAKTSPQTTAALVLGYNGYLVGGSLSANFTEHKLAKNAFAVGWQSSDLAISAVVTNGEEVLGNFWQKVAPALEYALQLKFNHKKSSTNFSAGVKYALDSDNSVKATLNSDQQVQFSFAHLLRHGIKLTLSTAVSARQIWGGAPTAAPPRVGLGLEFDSA
jgi:voltage-dependent anion channel protein 2